MDYHTSTENSTAAISSVVRRTCERSEPSRSPRRRPCPGLLSCCPSGALLGHCGAGLSLPHGRCTRCLRAKGLLFLNRPNFREVLECGSALPPWEWANRLESGKSTAALQDAGAHAQARAGSGAQSASKHPGLLIHKLSHWPFSYASDTVVQAENMTTSLTPAVALPHTTRVR